MFHVEYFSCIKAYKVTFMTPRVFPGQAEWRLVPLFINLVPSPRKHSPQRQIKVSWYYWNPWARVWSLRDQDSWQCLRRAVWEITVVCKIFNQRDFPLKCHCFQIHNHIIHSVGPNLTEQKNPAHSLFISETRQVLESPSRMSSEISFSLDLSPQT